MKELGVPEVVAFGMVIISNMHEEDMRVMDEGQEILDHNSMLFGYYIIPECELSLESYIYAKNENLSPGDSIEVIIQLIASLDQID